MSLREQKKRQARQGMVKAASQLINKQGFEQTTMRDIATAANVSYQTLYNYFPTKAQMVQAFLIEDITDIGSQVKNLIDDYDYNCLETLNQINKARVDVVIHRDRELWREVLIDYVKQESASNSIYQIIESTALQAFSRLLQLAQEAGELDPIVDCQLLSQVLFCIGEYAFMQYVMEPNVSKVEILQSLFEQADLVVSPYLRQAK